MTTLAHDAGVTPRAAGGFALALASAASFGLSGGLARGLLDAGWSPGAAVAVRVLGAALALVVPAVIALRGRWGLLRTHARLLTAYGLLAVALTQLAYFSAVRHMSVGVALLIEYTAPVAVVGWLWLRRGERPHRLTLVGGAVASAGLVLVLDVLGGAAVSPTGTLWALLAMIGAASYFLLSAEHNELPPLVLATGGLTIGGIGLLAGGLIGIVPLAATTRDVTYAGTTVAWWLPLLALALVTAAVAYTTGILAARLLGSRVASFTALTEVVFALLFAWLLLGELPRWVQLVGGLLILAGVVTVRLGETAQLRVRSRALGSSGAGIGGSRSPTTTP
jgi:drug/metabolite transporter (DMT)-like permease